jgi:hypothetical protein
MYPDHAPETFEVSIRRRFPVGADFHRHAGNYRAQIMRDGLRVTLGYLIPWTKQPAPIRLPGSPSEAAAMLL